MPAHAAACYESINAVTYTQLAALTDSLFQAGVNSFTPPLDVRLLAAAAGGTGIKQARVQAPGLLRLAYPSIVPLQSGLTTAVGQPHVCDYSDRPPILTAGEAVGIAVQNAGAAATFGFLLAGFNHAPVPPGPSIWLRYYDNSLGVVTAGTWLPYDASAISWDQTLPAGTYAIVGMDHWGSAGTTSVIAARLVLAGYNYRPGVLARLNVADTQNDSLFLDGRLGVLGYFTNQQMPGIEALYSGTGDTGFEGMLRIIRVGGPEVLPPSI